MPPRRKSTAPATPRDDQPAVDPAGEMGDRIQSARREAGFRTAQDFADALGISVWTVRSWEAAKSHPRYEMLAEVARLTDRPLAHFLGESPQQIQVPGDDQAQDLEAGAYGLAPYNRAAEQALAALSEAARARGVLLRLNTPAVATAEQIATIRAALEGLQHP